MYVFRTFVYGLEQLILKFFEARAFLGITWWVDPMKYLRNLRRYNAPCWTRC